MNFKFDDLLMGGTALGIALWGAFNEALFLTLFFGGILGSIFIFKIFFKEDTPHRKGTVKLAGLAITLASIVSVFSYTIEAEAYTFKPTMVVENSEEVVVIPYHEWEKPETPKEIPVEKPKNTFRPDMEIKTVEDEVEIVPVTLPEDDIADILNDGDDFIIGNLDDIISDIKEPEIIIEVEKEVEEPEIFITVEEKPEFIGGDKALLMFLSKNIKYPPIAKENNIEGRVIVEFVVMEDGSIQNARIVRGIGGGCDEEALRVVKSMPIWKAGRQRGKAVRVRYNVPVRFRLE